MNNKYSLTLFFIQLLCLLVGSVMLICYNLWGLIPFIWGGLMFLGYKELSGSQPREMGIITLYGKRTSARVEGLILLLDWLPMNIIGVSIFNMQIDDRDSVITPEKSIRCADGVRMIGVVSMALQANGANLDRLDDAKGMDGIFKITDDMCPSWLKDIAKTPGRTYQFMEDQNIEVAKQLRTRLEDPNNSLGGIANLGVTIRKLEVILRPLSDDIIKADQDQVVEVLERKAEEADTETINNQVLKRLKAYEVWAGNDAAKIKLIPTWKQLREEVVFERLAKDKKVTIIQGGRNVNLNTVGSTS